MKAGSLNAAIRTADHVKVRFSFGAVAVQKGSLIEAIRATHGSKAAETGLMLREDGFLTWERDNG